MKKVSNYCVIVCLLLILLPSNLFGDRPLWKKIEIKFNKTRDNRFGLDYVFPFEKRHEDGKIAELYSKTGVKWVNMAGITWAFMEKKPPVNGVHSYDWKTLDKVVKNWQKYDFNISFSLRTGKSWFAGEMAYKPSVLLPFYFSKSDRLPQKKYMKDFKAWIQALVERYDYDGVDDMSGLAKPILHYQMGNEYSNPFFWTGNMGDYRILLKNMAESARDANKDVKIISNGIRWNDMFLNDEKGEKLEKRFRNFLKKLDKNWQKEWRRSKAFIHYTVSLGDIYDILDGGGNGPYPESSSGYMAWIKKELKKNNLSNEIWDMESRCEPYIFKEPKLRFNQKELCIPDGKRILKILKNKNHPEHKKISKWYRIIQARLLVKVFVTRLAAGFEKVFMGMPEDWDKNYFSRLLAPNPYLGLCDSDYKPWAAYYSLQLTVYKLQGFTDVKKIDTGNNLQLYKFSFKKKKPVYVAWVRSKKVITPTYEGESTKLPKEFSNRLLHVTPVPYERDSSGLVKIESMNQTIDDHPLFIDVDPEPFKRK